MIGDSLENIFGSLGFAYGFAFCQNTGSLKIFQNAFWKKSFKNANRYQSFFGGIPTKKYQQKNGGSGGSKYGGFTKLIFHVFDRYEIHIQAFFSIFQ